MSDKKISEESAATALAGAEEFPAVQDGGNVKVTALQLATYIGAGKQPLDADLTAIAALVSAANKVPYATGAGAWALADFVPPGAYVSGRWYVPEGALFRSAGAAGATGIMRGRRWRLRAPITLDQLGVQITTGAASGNFQLAIYASDPASGAPTGAPLYSSSGISTASTGAIADSGPNLALAAGDYWIFLNVDASGAAAVFVAASNSALGAVQSVGSSSLGNALGATASASGHIRVEAYNSWPTLTGNFTADSLSEVQNGAIPVVAFSPA